LDKVEKRGKPMANTLPKSLVAKTFLATIAVCAVLAGCSPKAPDSAEPAATAPEQAQASEEPAATKPQEVGACVDTAVTLVGPRLEGVPDSGSAIEYANGMAQVDYSVVPAIANSQVGDAVRVCLVSVPENCPPGDDRGRVYSATNARTGETWTAPDSQHMCGGA
jgi:hypothetical protein